MLRSIVDNDMFDSVFLIALIALLFLPTSFLPTFVSFLIYITLCIKALFNSDFSSSFNSNLFI